MKVKVDVEGSEKLRELTREIKAQEKEIAEWNRLNMLGLATQKQFDQGITTATTKLRAARTELKGMQEGAASLKAVESAGGSAARGLLQLGYAVDDLQYGFAAIVNNIPMIASGLGAGPGIAGVAAIAAVAISQLWKHWGDLTALLQSAWEGGSAERLKELADRATVAAEAFDKLAAAGSEFEQKGAGERNKAIQNEGPAKLLRTVTDALYATGGQADMPQVVEGRFGPGEDIPGTPAWLAKKAFGRSKEQAEIEQRKATEEKAKGIIGGMEAPGEAGEAARNQMKRLITAIPGAFSEEFKKKFAESDPEQLKEDAAAEKRAKAAAVERKADTEMKAVQEADRKRVEKDIKERLETEKRTKIFRLEDQRDALQDQRKAIMDQMHMAPKSKIFGSTEERLQGLQQGILDQVPKQQLDTLKEIEKSIKSVDDSLKKERRARFA